MTSYLFSFRKTATQNPRIQILSMRLQKQRILLDFPPQTRNGAITFLANCTNYDNISIFEKQLGNLLDTAPKQHLALQEP